MSWSMINTPKAWEVFIRTYKTGYFVDLALERLGLLAALSPPTGPGRAD